MKTDRPIVATALSATLLAACSSAEQTAPPKATAEAASTAATSTVPRHALGPRRSRTPRTRLHLRGGRQGQMRAHPRAQVAGHQAAQPRATSPSSPGRRPTIAASAQGTCIGSKTKGTGVYYTARAGHSGLDSLLRDGEARQRRNHDARVHGQYCGVVDAVSDPPRGDSEGSRMPDCRCPSDIRNPLPLGVRPGGIRHQSDNAKALYDRPDTPYRYASRRRRIETSRRPRDARLYPRRSALEKEPRHRRAHQEGDGVPRSCSPQRPSRCRRHFRLCARCSTARRPPANTKRGWARKTSARKCTSIRPPIRPAKSSG